MTGALFIEKNPQVVRARLSDVLAIANAEKEALGFLPNAAYEQAADRRRLHLAFDGEEVVGFALFGSAFPHARVQQIGVQSSRRRHGIGSLLLKGLIEDLERDCYLTIKAKVASDLSAAQSFYAKHGFETAHEVAGGEARQRTLVVRVRHLETHSLLDASGRAFDWAAPSPDITFRRTRAGDIPFYAFDLNVLLDLVRDRARTPEANQLFAAALGHQIRVAVADEFARELQRTSSDTNNDPLLKFARQLPRMPPVNEGQLADLAALVHELVFSNSREANTPRALSDCKHVAHASLARATGFITSDGALLAARSELIARHGIDVTSLDEFVSLLPAEPSSPLRSASGAGFACRTVSLDVAAIHLRSLGADEQLLSSFCHLEIGAKHISYGIFDGEALVALAILVGAPTLGAPARLLVQISQQHTSADLFADHLFDTILERATQSSPIAIDLRRLPGQTLVSQVAEGRGFFETAAGYSKIALGRPLTPATWRSATDQVRRLIGVELPQSFDGRPFRVKDSAGRHHNLTSDQLEDLLAPTIVVDPSIEGVIVAIRREFAAELLNTDTQPTLAFVESKSASFLNRRAYISSPKNARFMKPGSPILFYESSRSGGRGAIVAVARIVDSLIQKKSAVALEDRRRLVVDKIDPFSSTKDVLITTFDSILRMPKPVSRDDLKSMGAAGNKNLQTATPISAENISLVLDAGWSIAN